MFKDPEVYDEATDDNYLHCWVPGSDGKIARVNGELNEHGREGIAGYIDEMTWHCNHP
jgi:hypothetical protein